MKTILGVTTGLLVGVALGIMYDRSSLHEVLCGNLWL